MAKKGKDDEGEEYEFAPPDFDEEAFIHKEIASFRATLIYVPWAVVVALVSWLLYTRMGGGDAAWWACLALAAAGGFALKYILPRLGADTAHYKRKEWTGTGLLFFIAWLGVFLLLVNPPFTDIAPPHVDIVASPPVQVDGGDVTLTVFARDNAKMDDVSIVVTGPDGATLHTTEDFEEGEHHRYRLDMDGVARGDHTVAVTATDGHGNEVASTLTFTVGGQPATFQVPQGGLDALTDNVEVVFPERLGTCRFSRERQDWRDVPCVRSVVLDIEGGGQVLMTPSKDTAGLWTADVRQEGWTYGTTHNVTPGASFGSTFIGKEHVPGGELRLASKSVFVAEGVLPDGDELEVAQHPADLQQAPPRNVPGPALLASLGVLAALAVAARRRAA